MRQTLTFAALLAGTLAVSACTSIDYNVTSYVATSSASARYGDSDPVDDWDGGGPHGHPVHGLDVAKYQGPIDWKTARSAGISFAFIKATEGGDRFDEMFNDHMSGARKAGIPAGAYHFYYFCTPAAVQARWFIRNVPRMKGSLPHVVDMEWNPHSPSCKYRPPAAKVRSEMKIFMDALERHYGKRPMIYTTVDFHEENLAGHLHDEVFWLRSVKAHPKVTYPGRRHAFWQYTGTGRVPGVRGDTDINVFAGSRDQWNQWLEKATR